MCQQNSHHLLSASSFTSSKRTKPVLPFHFLYDCLCLKKIEGEIQDTGHFPKNLLVCTCITVDLDYVISLKPKTVPIQSMHQARYATNVQICSHSAHSTEHASVVTGVHFVQSGSPECISSETYKSSNDT